MADNVNNPAHYNAHPSGLECVTIAEHFTFNVGNAVKYLWRAGLKGDAIEDPDDQGRGGVILHRGRDADGAKAQAPCGDGAGERQVIQAGGALPCGVEWGSKAKRRRSEDGYEECSKERPRKSRGRCH
jgi:hypothetical protein